ncbi:hypothetical protein ERJ75_001765300 [Trypanosoma vivax]|nr:hypothetical protein TRVL_02502 [Trypanosoma vivax]KAH8604065.1 hypothetical protein ERJ75_001765300 [Trypanosoma vivax]
MSHASVCGGASRNAVNCGDARTDSVTASNARFRVPDKNLLDEQSRSERHDPFHSEPLQTSFPGALAHQKRLNGSHCSSSSPSSSSLSSERIGHLWQMVQDLRAENATLQQRISVLMEGEMRMPIGELSGMPPSIKNNEAFTDPASFSYLEAEREALILRVRRLEAALKLEAQEREALELRLRAQERVIAKMVRR